MWCFRGQAGCGGGKERSPLLNVKLFPTHPHNLHRYMSHTHEGEGHLKGSVLWSRIFLQGLCVTASADCPTVYFRFVNKYPNAD